MVFFSSALSTRLRLHHGNHPFLFVGKWCFIFAEFPLWHLYRMTINFPFPLIKSNSFSDSVWRWCLGLCGTLQPFTWRDSAFLQGDRDLPWDVPTKKATAGGQLVVLGETWTHGDAQGAGLELRGSMGKAGGSPGQGKSSTAGFQWAACTPRVEQGDKAQSPSLPSPFPAEAQSSCQGFFPPAPSPCSGTCRVSLPALSSGTTQLWP